MKSSRIGDGALTAVAAAWIALPALFAGCSPGYVLRAGWEELQILERRRSIQEAVHDTTLSSDLRRKLRLVVDAREFAGRSLGLDPGDSFTSFASVESDTLLLVVSAAEPYRLQWKTWWFPIVGRVPYRGYFDFDEARRLERRLRDQNYDVYVRPTAAFSTLGWLPDPVLSTTLAADSVGIVETVIHEITHSTFYRAGAAEFNESFANFVGYRGAVEFFCEALADEYLCGRARDRWHDTRVFGEFYMETLAEFRELYARDLPMSEMERRKRALFRRSARRYRQGVRPRLRAGVYGELEPSGLNNAWLLGRILYYRRLDDFERVYGRTGDLRESVDRIVSAARESADPWESLDLLLTDLEEEREGDPDDGETSGPPSP